MCGLEIGQATRNSGGLPRAAAGALGRVGRGSLANPLTVFVGAAARE